MVLRQNTGIPPLYSLFLKCQNIPIATPGLGGVDIRSYLNNLTNLDLTDTPKPQELVIISESAVVFKN